MPLCPAKLRDFLAELMAIATRPPDDGSPLAVSVLEQRVLLSATPVAVEAAIDDQAADLAVGGHAASLVRELQAAQPTTDTGHFQTQRRELVLIDQDLPQSTLLSEAFGELTAADPDVDRTIVWFSGGATLEELVDSIEASGGDRTLDAVHLLTHGRDGVIEVGRDTLSRDTLASHGQQLERLGGLLRSDGDLLIYGCDVGESEAGRSFLHDLSIVSGLDLAASDDLTGHASLGGDWDLEHEIGVIGATTLSVSDWEHVLTNTRVYQGRTGPQRTVDVTYKFDGGNGSFNDLDDEELKTKWDGSGRVSASLLRFENLFGDGSKKIATGSSVHSATLFLYVTDTLNIPVDLFQFPTSWHGGSATAAFKASALTTLNGTPVASTTPSSEGWISFDVTASLDSWSRFGENHGWILQQQSPDGEAKFASSDDDGDSVSSPIDGSSVGRGPILRVEYSDPPVAIDVIHVTNLSDAVNGETSRGFAFLASDDGGDGVSLREAVAAAQSNPVESRILVSIPTSLADAAGRYVIDLNSPLDIGAEITLEGDNLQTLDRENLILDATGLATGVTVSTGASGSSIGDLAVVGASDAQLVLDADEVLVFDSYFGQTAAADIASNAGQVGVRILGDDNVLGDSHSRNVIRGNQTAVEILGSGTLGNEVAHNRFNASQTATSNPLRLQFHENDLFDADEGTHGGLNAPLLRRVVAQPDGTLSVSGAFSGSGERTITLHEVMANGTIKPAFLERATGAGSSDGLSQSFKFTIAAPSGDAAALVAMSTDHVLGSSPFSNVLPLTLTDQPETVTTVESFGDPAEVVTGWRSGANSRTVATAIDGTQAAVYVDESTEQIVARVFDRDGSSVSTWFWAFEPGGTPTGLSLAVDPDNRFYAAVDYASGTEEYADVLTFTAETFESEPIISGDYGFARSQVAALPTGGFALALVDLRAGAAERPIITDLFDSDGNNVTVGGAGQLRRFGTAGDRPKAFTFAINESGRYTLAYAVDNMSGQRQTSVVSSSHNGTQDVSPIASGFVLAPGSGLPSIAVDRRGGAAVAITGADFSSGQPRPQLTVQSVRASGVFDGSLVAYGADGETFGKVSVDVDDEGRIAAAVVVQNGDTGVRSLRVYRTPEVGDPFDSGQTVDMVGVDELGQPNVQFLPTGQLSIYWTSADTGELRRSVETAASYDLPVVSGSDQTFALSETITLVGSVNDPQLASSFEWTLPVAGGGTVTRTTATPELTVTGSDVDGFGLGSQTVRLTAIGPGGASACEFAVTITDDPIRFSGDLDLPLTLVGQTETYSIVELTGDVTGADIRDIQLVGVAADQASVDIDYAGGTVTVFAKPDYWRFLPGGLPQGGGHSNLLDLEIVYLDRLGRATPRHVHVPLEGIEDPPTISNVPTQTLNPGESLQLALDPFLIDVDTPVSAYTWSVSGGNYVGDARIQGRQLHYEAAAGLGDATISVTATWGGNSVGNTVPVTLNDLPPVIDTPVGLSVPVDSPPGFVAMLQGTDPNGQSLTWSLLPASDDAGFALTAAGELLRSGDPLRLDPVTGNAVLEVHLNDGAEVDTRTLEVAVDHRFTIDPVILHPVSSTAAIGDVVGQVAVRSTHPADRTAPLRLSLSHTQPFALIEDVVASAQGPARVFDVQVNADLSRMVDQSLSMTVTIDGAGGQEVATLSTTVIDGVVGARPAVRQPILPILTGRGPVAIAPGLLLDTLESDIDESLTLEIVDDGGLPTTVEPDLGLLINWPDSEETSAIVIVRFRNTFGPSDPIVVQLTRMPQLQPVDEAPPSERVRPQAGPAPTVTSQPPRRLATATARPAIREVARTQTPADGGASTSSNHGETANESTEQSGESLPASVAAAGLAVSDSPIAATPQPGNASGETLSSDTTGEAGPSQSVAESRVSFGEAESRSERRARSERNERVGREARSVEQSSGSAYSQSLAFGTQPVSWSIFAADGGLYEALDDVGHDVTGTTATETAVGQAAVTVGGSFTVGYVLWTLRSGLLVSGLLAQMPAWRLIDPLVVLDGLAADQDGESLESMIEDAQDQFSGDA